VEQPPNDPRERHVLIQWISARVHVPTFQARLQSASLEDLRSIRAEIERNTSRFAEKGRLVALAEDDDEAFADI
jgi:hypothetical protein